MAHLLEMDQKIEAALFAAGGFICVVLSDVVFRLFDLFRDPCQELVNAIVLVWSR